MESYKVKTANFQLWTVLPHDIYEDSKLLYNIHTKTNETKNKVISEICGKSTWHSNLSRLAALRVTFSKNQKTHF